jgi:predicted DCC family thiol-disulfide oxidoreductase YuxK
LDTVFYDGTCGFCHRSVKSLMAADCDGSRFRYAPLGGETFLSMIPENDRTSMPDSLVVHTADGRLLFRSTAVLYLMRRLGGWRRVLAFFGGFLPRMIRDFLYDRFAAVRHRLFRRPNEACPLLPPSLRARFDP